MPLLTADPVTVLPGQREALEQLVRTHSTPQQVALRARIILHAVEGVGVRESARELVSGRRRRGTGASGGGRGRQVRGLRTARRCAAIRGAGDVHARANLRRGGDDMRETVGERTPDQPMDPARNCRRGHTTRRRAEHLATLSGAFFKKEADLKPHRIRYWLTPKPDPAFDSKCADICAVYKAAAGADDTHRTISIDEMTGIQALERIAPGLPLVPGKVERCEFEYKRHGTETLIAAFNVTTGEVEGVVGNTRTEKDFTRFLRHLLSSAAPTTNWAIVATISTSTFLKSVVRLVARVCGLKVKLGVKESRACSHPRRPEKHSCATRSIASPSTSRPNRHHGLIRSRFGFPSWRESFFAAAIRQQKRLAQEDRAVHRLFNETMASPSAGL